MRNVFSYLAMVRLVPRNPLFCDAKKFSA
ncbi:protein of unknown function [Burkholderia multivorans]